MARDSRRKLPQAYRELAAFRGFSWLGPEVPNVLTSTWWQCSCGHKWQAKYGNIQQGKGCPKCAGVIQKLPAEYKQLAESRGFDWIGPQVSTVQAKTGWRCRAGHEWRAPLKHIKNGSGCPHCAGTARKVPADYIALGNPRGFYWLGPSVPNTAKKTRWKCRHGHAWMATYNGIRSGTGCPVCSGRTRKHAADYDELGNSRGFAWLGPLTATTSEKTRWQCGFGHIWHARWDDIKRGRGCPHCSGRAKRTPADYHMLASQRQYTWLGSAVKKTTLRTGWRCHLGHEWQTSFSSMQQGSGCPTCAKYQGARKRRTKDSSYQALAHQRGFLWLGPSRRTTKEKTDWRCPKGHQWSATFDSVLSGSGCPHCAGQAKKLPEDYHAIAAARQFRWLGATVTNAGTVTPWECPNGHRWEASYDSVQRGTGCPVCARIEQADRQRYSPTEYNEIARRRGFEWLGPTVERTGEKTTWRCDKGHQWEAIFNSIQQGSGCPVCGGTLQKMPDDYHALAREIGYSWKGPEVTNTSTKTLWECESGHRWETSYDVVRRGCRCPLCQDLVNGARVSRVQRELCDLVDGELNVPCGRYNIDVAIERNGSKIAIEYDSWYWHAGREKEERRRDLFLQRKGWKLIRIRSNNSLPMLVQLESVIENACGGIAFAELTLEDWGIGATFFDSN